MRKNPRRYVVEMSIAGKEDWNHVGAPFAFVEHAAAVNALEDRRGPSSRKYLDMRVWDRWYGETVFLIEAGK